MLIGVYHAIKFLPANFILEFLATYLKCLAHLRAWSYLIKSGEAL